MLKDGLFYENDDGIISFFQNKLEKYNFSLKREETVHIFADMATSSFNKIALLEKNCIEIKNFVQKQLIVKIKLDSSDKVTTMSLGETILLIGRDDGKIGIISMFSKKKEIQFKVSEYPIDSIFLNTESIVSIISNDEIYVTNIVDRTILAKIKETSTITSIVGDNKKIIYVVDNHVILYNFKNNKREILYTGEDIKDIFYNNRLFVLDKKKLLIINNRHKSTKIAKIKADKFTIMQNKIFYTKSNKVYKTNNLFLKRKINNTVRILTVDDSNTMRLILKDTILKNFKNVEVYEAKDGHEAMKALKKNSIDVMFLDWNMPLMDGEEVVNIINELNIYPDLKIIMATTEDSASNVKRMVNKGVKGYIIKPFSISSIVPLTKRIIDIVLKGRDV